MASAGLLREVVCTDVRTLAGAATGRDIFQEVPAAKSGIKWVHTAASRLQKHVPETSGAGCAFIDYDNDGWMDNYLVNSGKCDFYDPPRPLQNALATDVLISNNDGAPLLLRNNIGAKNHWLGVRLGSLSGGRSQAGADEGRWWGLSFTGHTAIFSGTGKRPTFPKLARRDEMARDRWGRERRIPARWRFPANSRLPPRSGQ